MENAPVLNADLEKRFTYHQPVVGQPEKYTSIRNVAKNFGYCLVGVCPQSRELSLALTHLEEVCFWANAAIARNEKS